MVSSNASNKNGNSTNNNNNKSQPVVLRRSKRIMKVEPTAVIANTTSNANCDDAKEQQSIITERDNNADTP